MLKLLFTIAALFALTTSASATAGFSTFSASATHAAATKDITPVGARRTFKSAQSSVVSKKSDRQKCLDMMLPQDGADCLKKLKAKTKKD